MKNIYDYIDEMRLRTRMYTNDFALGPIQTLLTGYCACRDIRQIDEGYEGRVFGCPQFGAWLESELGWTSAFGFASAIEENTLDQKASFDTFFDLMLRFRNSSLADV